MGSSARRRRGWQYVLPLQLQLDLTVILKMKTEASIKYAETTYHSTVQPSEHCTTHDVDTFSQACGQPSVPRKASTMAAARGGAIRRGSTSA